MCCSPYRPAPVVMFVVHDGGRVHYYYSYDLDEVEERDPEEEQ